MSGSNSESHAALIAENTDLRKELAEAREAIRHIDAYVTSWLERCPKTAWDSFPAVQAAKGGEG